ncbi:MAG TPA: glutamate-cysteine ligase family protein [Nannocystaceae bacterium]|nr:glutamate-cysteine ligase family protein [Nannocystaceae bacterium]
MTLHIFSAVGIELEYMIVHRETLDVDPICDDLLREIAGDEQVNEVEAGALRFSNELALHVLELKTNGPAPDITALPAVFAAGIRQLEERLIELGAMLLPTAMHPTMTPEEGKLWPHDGKPIYATYDRVFGTRGHGWVNLQSCHVNLPFAGDDEFGRLHAAVRALLPLLPALAASSPVLEGRIAEALDMRLEVYRANQRRIPSIIGQVIPEPVWTRADYEHDILAPMYADIAPFDPEGELQEEWLNSRGAIARFDRDALEIRVLDTQERPAADLAIAALVTAVARALVEERWVALAELKALATEPLAALFGVVVREADEAIVDHAPLLRALGCTAASVSTRELWDGLVDRVWPASDRSVPPVFRAAIATILEQGTLARRIRAKLGEAPTRGRIDDVYHELAACLVEDRAFAEE